MNPVDDEWKDIEEVQFLNHVMALYGIESGTEIDKEYGCKIVRR